MSGAPAVSGAACGSGLFARRAALWVLEKARAPRSVLAELFAAAERHYMLQAPDRALMRAIVLACLKERRILDRVLRRLMDRPLKARHRRIRHILHMGLAQLLVLEIPPHAVVSTAVALAREGDVRSRPLAGLVNAVLRRAARERDSLAEWCAGQDPLALLPDWLAARWRANLGESRARAIAAVIRRPAPLDLVARDPAAAGRLRADLDALPLPGGVLRLAEPTDVRALPGYEEGLFWVQDWAATLPARLLDSALRARGHAPADGPVVDLCAAPGGKSAQLAVAGWEVLAVDRSPARLARLARNMRRLRLHAQLVAADAATFALARPVPGLLLDAPCSATGTLRRHPDIAFKRGPRDIAELAAAQRALLDNAARLVAPGGVLVYAVCSLEPEEGAEQIAAFLACHPGFRRLPVAREEVFGLEEALTPAGDVLTHPALLAEEGGVDGFFVARLVRTA